MSDRTSLWLHPFFSALGTTLFDLRGKAVERLHVINGGVMDLDISEKTQRQIFSHKLFEAGVSRFVLTTLHSGDTFVDIGANVGYFTVLAATAVGTKGKVIAVEPEKRNFELLSHNVSENGYNQVSLYNCAVGRENDTKTLHINPLNHGGNSLLPFEMYASGQERYSVEEIQAQYKEEYLFEKVPVRPLDEIVRGEHIQSISIVKIDVEGFEEEVLKGAQNMITQRVVKHFICEVNNDARRRDVFQLFIKNGYVPYRISFAGVPETIPPEEDIQKLHGNVLFSLSTRDDKRE